MRLMRKRNPQVKEDGFGALLPHAAEYVPELLAEFRDEQNDHGLRCWLLELLGEARSPELVPFFAEQLTSQDDSFRDWAVHALRQIGTKQAREVLYRAGLGRKPATVPMRDGG